MSYLVKQKIKGNGVVAGGGVYVVIMVFHEQLIKWELNIKGVILMVEQYQE